MNSHFAIGSLVTVSSVASAYALPSYFGDEIDFAALDYKFYAILFTGLAVGVGAIYAYNRFYSRNVTVQAPIKGILQCAASGDIKGLEALIKAGGNLFIVTLFGKTALHDAVSYPKFLKELLDWHRAQIAEGKKGFDLDAQTDMGNTALHGAMQLGDLEAINLLLGAGARYDIPNMKLPEEYGGKTARQIAEDKNLAVTFPT